MVKRYPHTAIVTVKTDGGLVNGEWVDGGDSAIEVKGRFDPIDTNDVLRTNSQGIEQIVRGEFYTKQKKVAGAVSLEIAEFGIKRNIICWWDYQTHSVISV